MIPYQPPMDVCAGIALEVASQVIGKPVPPRNRRDQHNVRGLACRILYDLRKPIGWNEVRQLIYGKGRHATAIEGAQRWPPDDPMTVCAQTAYLFRVQNQEDNDD